MRTLFVLFAAFVFGGVSLCAAEQTWTGKISDSMCGAKHMSSAEHGAKAMSDRECTLACIKKGAKYVFVTDGKVYNIANQDSPGLEEHAGHTVKLTGNMNGETITVSKIEMAKSRAKTKGKKESD